jgi:hypothetical protein
MVHATVNPGEYLLYFSVLIEYNVGRLAGKANASA